MRLRRSAPFLVLAAALQAVHAQLPDPTMPADYGSLQVIELPKELARWKLTGIKYSAGRKRAILNDRLVGIGESIGAATVVDITPTSVVLEQDGARLKVSLVPASVKTSAGAQP